ncbi:hypothetical protein DFP72DRAFT_849880 [Ephemerocybe angulata]|uniref:Uncharacterized protein n=1 Tax=Ephemerocybe angulata TaxID=980116 RepID=A0A8H6M504_9AGAR|nr:hypothetical protein DFP72DRAFT_849880 [Tulosesus angulatus]
MRIRLFDLLTRPELVRLSCTSSTVKEYVDIYSEDAWNISNFLDLWFDSPYEFRSYMALTGAVLTGSQAIRFFDRRQPDPSSDLDIVTRIGGTMSLCLYLEEQGYVRVARSREAEDEYPLLDDVLSLSSTKRFCSGSGGSGILGIFDFEKGSFPPFSNGSWQRVKVQVITVTQSPIWHIIHTFHSTLAMNYITYKEAVAVFPKATFLDRVAYPSSRKKFGEDWTPQWKTKYERRGFRFDTRSRKPALKLGDRSTKDKQCWRVPLNDRAETFGQRCVWRGSHMGAIQCSPHARELSNYGGDIAIRLGENTSVYAQSEEEEFNFELSWVPEGEYPTPKRYRLGIYEPEIWDYLYPWHILQ